MAQTYPFDEHTAALHGALRRLRRKDTPDSLAAIADIRGAIEKGADPNGCDTNGHTPLDFLATDPRAQGRGSRGRVQFDVAISLLIQAGADPMRPGCKLLESMPHTVLRQVFGDMRRREADGFENAYHNGQNPLHILAERQPFSITAAFDWGTPEMKPFGEVPAHWINQARDNDGATPLHVLWDRYPVHELWGMKVKHRWAMTEKMIKAEADVFLLDEYGHTVADKILAAVKNGVSREEFPDHLYEAIEARQENDRLQEKTPTAAGARSRSPRL